MQMANPGPTFKNFNGRYKPHCLPPCLNQLHRMPGGGGGTQSGKEGTDCSLTAGQRWLSRPAMAEKGGLYFYYIVG